MGVEYLRRLEDRGTLTSPSLKPIQSKSKSVQTPTSNSQDSKQTLTKIETTPKKNKISAHTITNSAVSKVNGDSSSPIKPRRLSAFELIQKSQEQQEQQEQLTLTKRRNNPWNQLAVANTSSRSNGSPWKTQIKRRSRKSSPTLSPTHSALNQHNTPPILNIGTPLKR